MIYRIKMEELKEWIKHKAQVGDIAFSKTHHDEREYMYAYKGPDPHPAWFMVQEDLVDNYLEEINKLKIEDTAVSKRCETCKYFKNTDTYTWCTHIEHAGMYVHKFVSCTDYEHKEKKPTPFDGVKLYLIDDKSGELGIKYVCEDCGKLMDEPGHWWLALPLRDINGKQTRPFGYHFRCEECDKKKDGKI